MEINNEMIKNETPILNLDIGIYNSLAINTKSQIFSWGINIVGLTSLNFENSFESNSSPKKIREGIKQLSTFSENRIKQIISGDSHSAALDYEGNLFVWGANEEGQLGSGNYEPANQPQKLINSIPIGGIKDIAIKGKLNIAVTNEGDAYMWPTRDLLGEPILIPVRLPFTKLIQIESASCGSDFVLLLTTQGTVFSFGKAAEYGQLGHGDTRPRLNPELILALKDYGERIQNISCGHAHSIAKSALGKIYTWGYGGLGQLGHGTLNSEFVPKLLNSYNKDLEGGKKKVLSIAAGYSHTMFILEGRIPYYFGTCGVLYKQTIPIKFPLEKRYPELFSNKGLSIQNSSIPQFSLAKLSINWSKTHSVTHAVILDIRAASSQISSSPKGKGENLTGFSLGQQLNLLCSKWNSKDLDAPYIEGLASLFLTTIMKKPGTAIKKKISKNVKKEETLGNIVKNAIKKGINYDENLDESLKEKTKEIEQKLVEILGKEGEMKNEYESSLSASIINKVFK